MTDEQLKQAVNFNPRPDIYMKGDRVIVRAPEDGENRSSWGVYKHHEGRIGTLQERCRNTDGGITRIEFDDGDNSALRTHWIELIEPGGEHT